MSVGFNSLAATVPRSPCTSVSVSAPPVENIVMVGSDGGGFGAALAWASVSADMHLGIQLVLFVA